MRGRPNTTPKSTSNGSQKGGEGVKRIIIYHPHRRVEIQRDKENADLNITF